MKQKIWLLFFCCGLHCGPSTTTTTTAARTNATNPLSSPLPFVTPQPLASSPLNGTSNITSPDGVIVTTMNQAERPGTGLPPMASDFKVLGWKGETEENAFRWVSPEISTDSVLKVDLTAKALGTVPGTGFQINFRCLQLDVQALGVTSTVLLSVAGPIFSGPCNGARAIVSLDYAARLAPGQQTLKVTLSNPRTDSCYTQYPNGRGFYFFDCMLQQAHKLHQFTGTVTMRVNGTW